MEQVTEQIEESALGRVCRLQQERILQLEAEFKAMVEIATSHQQTIGKMQQEHSFREEERGAWREGVVRRVIQMIEKEIMPGQGYDVFRRTAIKRIRQEFFSTSPVVDRYWRQTDPQKKIYVKI
jgi:hypothetical protein